jgi:acyl-coenzyme A synthetase/AMP-(fatty) acid ligase
LHTGDIGYLDETGFLYYVGRKDRQFKFGGRNINPAFVEQCIARHPQVQEVVVTRVDSDRDEFICATIKVRNVHEDDLQRELKRLCMKHMPTYMVPKKFILEDHDQYYYKGKLFLPVKEQLPSIPEPGRNNPAVELSQGKT